MKAGLSHYVGADGSLLHDNAPDELAPRTTRSTAWFTTSPADTREPIDMNVCPLCQLLIATARANRIELLYGGAARDALTKLLALDPQPEVKEIADHDR